MIFLNSIYNASENLERDEKTSEASALSHNNTQSNLENSSIH